MAAITFLSVIPLLFIVVIIIAVVALIISTSRRTLHFKQYSSGPAHQRYVPGEFSQQMELDMRLPYRRFKKLYPGSNISYDEYKKMQTRSAFRRSLSSQQNRRMVR